MLPLKNTISEAYALDISRKCKAVQRQSIKDGSFVGQIAPYGYDLSKDDCHKLVIDAEAAAVVRRIFNGVLDGMTNGEITRELNDSNVMPPSRYMQSKGISTGKNIAEHWSARYIAGMLSDRAYAGDMVQGKTQTVNHKEIKMPPDKWVIVENTHEPIISREVFDEVQRIRKRVSESEALRRQNIEAYTPNLFKGRIYCAKCGHIMRRKRQNKDDSYWFRCDSTWKFSKKVCTVVSIKEADLKTEIITLLHKHSEAVLGRFIRVKEESKHCTFDVELREINSQLNNSGTMLKSLYENMIGGLITPDEFTQMKADYESKIAKLSNRANEIRSLKYQAESRKAEYTNIAGAVSAVTSNDKLTEEIIDILIEKILVNPDKSFEVQFKFADEFAEAAS